MRILLGVCPCGFLCKAAVRVASGLSCKAAVRVASGFSCKAAVCVVSGLFMQSRSSRVSGPLLPMRMRFPASAPSHASAALVESSFPCECCFRASAPVPESYRREVSFLPLRAHLSGDRSITINPLSAVHFWYFSSISGRNREAFYQKYFYGISVLADILGIKPYFHKKNTRNHYQINSSW